MFSEILKSASNHLPSSVIAADAKLFRNFLFFLEDRRVLYDPMQAEVPRYAVESVLEIRKELVSLRQSAQKNGALLLSVSAQLQGACRRFLNVVDGPDGRVERPIENPYGNGLRFIDALGQLRGTFGENLQVLSIYYSEPLPAALASLTLSEEASEGLNPDA